MRKRKCGQWTSGRRYIFVWMRCLEIWFDSDSTGDRRTVGLDDLVDPFHHCDSMIL